MNHTPAEVHYFHTDQLAIHPALENFPGLSDDQLAVLNQSIKEHGVQQPLITDEDLNVIDGRARMAAARALELLEVPVVIQPAVKDVVAFAIESAVVRRQLTRSGIALALFEAHPEMAKGGKAGRPKNNCSTGEQLNASHDSYRKLGARYRVHASYFAYLAEMKAEMTAEEWAELRRVVLFEEASIPRQYAGFRTGLPAGSKRGAVVYAYVNDEGLLEGILPRAFSSIREGFSRWGDQIDTRSKAAIEKEWAELLDAAPAELVRIAQRKAAKQEGRA